MKTQFFDYFDAIFLINLNERKDRLEESLNEFAKYKLDPKILRFPAINYKHTKHPLAGRGGCFASHRAIIQHAKDNNLKNVLVFEDDFCFTCDPNDILNKNLDFLKNNHWDLFYLGQTTTSEIIKKPLIPVADGVLRLKGGLATHAIAYNQSIYDILLNELPPNEEIINWLMVNESMDGWILKNIQSNDQYKCYTTDPMLCIQRASFSDIDNKFADYSANQKIAFNDLRNKLVKNKSSNEISSKFLTYKQLGKSGSIGNQLFQLAALVAFATDNGLTPKIPKHEGYFEETYGRFVDYVPNGIDTGLEWLNDEDSIQNEVIERSFNYNKLKITPNSSLSGYFQSEKYFAHHASLIRSLFLNFKPEIQEQINTIAAQLPINKELTAIHVRRGDYLQKQEFHPVQTLEYYNLAKKEIGGDQTYVVFSDDIEWCKQNFDDSHYFIETGNSFVDLGVMSCCDNFIIANSSFSWWGAWLSTNEKKKVVAPQKWFGYKNSHINTADLIPKNWITINDKPIINLKDREFAHAKLMCNGDLSSVNTKFFDWNRDFLVKSDVCIYTDLEIGMNTIAQNHEKHKINVGLLMEPYSISTGLYDYLSQPQIHSQYDIILTHCQSLINCNPNIFKFYPFGGTWIKENDHKLHDKNKNISIIASSKSVTTGHKLRHEVIKSLDHSILDVFGGEYNYINYKGDGLIPYRYSIIIENDNNNYFFSEKLIDCLITGTIPIYWGSNVSRFFDTDGFVLFNSIQDLKVKLPVLNEETYIKLLPKIEKNLELARQYIVTEDNIWKILNKNFKYIANNKWRKKLQIFV